MNALLTFCAAHLPAWYKRRKLGELFAATAAAFEADMPNLQDLAYDECLRAYALFTAGQVQTAIAQQRDLDAIRLRLYHNAYQIGADLARTFRVKTTEDAMRAGQILYKLLGIEFRGTAQGDITIAQCYFSAFYSGQTCRIMSGLDAGVFAGLTHGAQLNFAQRITEGSPQCRACLRSGGCGI